MSFIRRKLEPRPYATGSTGRPRGILSVGRIGRVQVYEAIGEARETFADKLGPAIVTYLNENSDKLQDSASIVDFSLFMMGKSPERTKPIVMCVSDNKQVRKEAFRMIEKSAIMKDYPGFGLGQMGLKAEFENLQPLGSQEDLKSVGAIDTPSTPFITPDESLRVGVLVTETGSFVGGQLKAEVQNGLTTRAHLAAVGGVVSYHGQYFLHSIEHFLQHAPTYQDVVAGHGESLASETNEDECDIIGLSDEEDNEDGRLADATSHGSASPVPSDSGSTSDSLLESEPQEGPEAPYEGSDDEGEEPPSGALDFEPFLRVLSREHTTPENWAAKQPDGVSDGGARAESGLVALRSSLLDSTFTWINTFGATATRMVQLRKGTIPLESYQEHIETAASDSNIRLSTPNGKITGRLSGTPSFVRLPGSRIFQEVYVAMLNRPLLPGDCGSWANNVITEKLVGHVIAGSPTTGLTLLMPAAKVFAEALVAFSADDEISGSHGRDSPSIEANKEETKYADSDNLERIYSTIRKLLRLQTIELEATKARLKATEELIARGATLHNQQKIELEAKETHPPASAQGSSSPMSRKPCVPGGAELPTAEPMSGPGLSRDRAVGQTPSAPHVPSQTRRSQRSGFPLLPAPVRQQNPLMKRLLQQLRASLAIESDKEMMLPVLVVDANSKPQALLARFSQKYELSLVTASAVRDLGFEPFSLPPGVLNPFICPLGRIKPVRYVGLVVEQARNNLSPTLIGNVIVLDDRFNDRGPDLYLGRQFLQDAFDGNLPPKVSNTVGDAGERQNAPNPMSLAQSSNNNPPVWTSPMPVGTATQQV